jgi:hypothetical protein
VRIASLLSIFTAASTPAVQGGAFDAVLQAAISDGAQQHGGDGSMGKDAKASTGLISGDQENQALAAKSDASAESEVTGNSVVNSRVDQYATLAVSTSSTARTTVAETAVPTAESYWGRSASIAYRQSVADVPQKASSSAQVVASPTVVVPTTANFGPVQFHAAESLSRTVDGSSQEIAPTPSIVSTQAARAGAAPAPVITSLSFAAVPVVMGNRASGTAIDASPHDARVAGQPSQPSQTSLSQAATAAPKAFLPAPIQQGIALQTQATPRQALRAVALQAPFSSEAIGSTPVNDGPVSIEPTQRTKPATKPIATAATREVQPSVVATKARVVETSATVPAAARTSTNIPTTTVRVNVFTAQPVQLRGSAATTDSTVKGVSFYPQLHSTTSTVPTATVQTVATTETTDTTQAAVTTLLPTAGAVPVQAIDVPAVVQPAVVREAGQVVSATPQTGHAKAGAAAGWVAHPDSSARNFTSTAQMASSATIVSSTVLPSTASTVQTPLAGATQPLVAGVAPAVSEMGSGAGAGSMPRTQGEVNTAQSDGNEVVVTAQAVAVSSPEAGGDVDIARSTASDAFAGQGATTRREATLQQSGSLEANGPSQRSVAASNAEVAIDPSPQATSSHVAAISVDAVTVSSVAPTLKVAAHTTEVAMPVAAPIVPAVAAQAEVATLPVAAELLSAAIDLPTVAAPTSGAVQAAAAPAQKEASRVTGKGVDVNGVAAAQRTSAAASNNGTNDTSVRSIQGNGQPAQHGTTDASPVTAASAVANAQGVQAPAIPSHEAAHGAALAASSLNGAADASREASLRGDAASLHPEVDEAAPATGINSASVMQAMGGTEMRVGMHSTEFGNISIRTSLSPDQIQTQISVDHGDLGQAITAHATLVQARFQEQYGVHASIQVNQQGSTTSGEPGGSAQREQQGFVRSVRNESDATADEAEIGLGQLAAAGTSSGSRLDIRA